MQQQLAKETKAIAALKQHYERYHGKDLAALKELYEYHAANSVRAAELTVDPRRREEYLKLAREWTEAADKAKPADDAPSARKQSAATIPIAAPVPYPPITLASSSTRSKSRSSQNQPRPDLMNKPIFAGLRAAAAAHLKRFR